jgi:hypothetical protein
MWIKLIITASLGVVRVLRLFFGVVRVLGLMFLWGLIKMGANHAPHGL